MHLTAFEKFCSSAFNARRLSPWISIFPFHGLPLGSTPVSGTPYEYSGFSIRILGSTGIFLSYLPIHVSSSLVLFAIFLFVFFSHRFIHIFDKNLKRLGNSLQTLLHRYVLLSIIHYKPILYSSQILRNTILINNSLI